VNYPQKSVQQAAATTIGLLRTEAAIPDLQKVFRSSEDKDVRAAALDALAFMPTKETAPLFTQYLSDKDKRLRISSALGLGRLQDGAYMTNLEKSAQTEKDTGVRLALDFAFVKNGKNDPIAELISNLSSRIHRGEAVPYLTELARDAKIRELLRPYLSSRDADIRKNLCVVYAASGDAQSVAYLEDLTRDRDSEVSSEASRAIRVIRSRGQ
jgi:HEAT repeat protein